MERDENKAVHIVEREGRPLLLLQGTVDVFSAEQFRQAALQLVERGEDTVACCEQTEHLHTSALQILLALREGLREKGKRLKLQGVSAPMVNLLHLAGLASALLQEETEI